MFAPIKPLAAIVQTTAHSAKVQLIPMTDEKKAENTAQ
jgi:hypothetical protein